MHECTAINVVNDNWADVSDFSSSLTVTGYSIFFDGKLPKVTANLTVNATTSISSVNLHIRMSSHNSRYIGFSNAELTRRKDLVGDNTGQVTNAIGQGSNKVVGAVAAAGDKTTAAVKENTTAVTGVGNQVTGAVDNNTAAVKDGTKQVTDGLKDVDKKLDKVSQDITDKMDEQYQFKSEQSDKMKQKINDMRGKVEKSSGAAGEAAKIGESVGGLFSAAGKSSVIKFPAFEMTIEGKKYRMWGEQSFDFKQLHKDFSVLMKPVNIILVSLVYIALVFYMRRIYTKIFGGD